MKSHHQYWNEYLESHYQYWKDYSNATSSIGKNSGEPSSVLESMEKYLEAPINNGINVKNIGELPSILERILKIFHQYFKEWKEYGKAPINIGKNIVKAPSKLERILRRPRQYWKVSEEYFTAPINIGKY